MLLVLIETCELLQVEVLEQRFLVDWSEDLGERIRGRECGSHHCLRTWCTYKVRIKSSTSKEIR